MLDLFKYKYSIVAGIFAAAGSFFGKLPSVLSAEDLLGISSSPGGTSIWMLGVSSVLPILLMIVCNVLMWRYFLKALQMNEQTLTTTVLTAASNYTVSFLLGTIIYKESFSVISALGTVLIVCGLWLLCYEPTKPKVS